MTAEIETFAEFIVANLRDPAIRNCSDTINRKGVQADRWREAFKDSSTGQLIDVIVPDVVDQVMFELLLLIDSQVIDLKWSLDDDKDPYRGTESEQEGTAAGSYLDEWRELYSNETVSPY